MFDELSGSAVIILAIALSFAYIVRIRRKGAAQFERVERQGSSALLGKSLMQMGYWGMQPLGRFLVACKVTPDQISWASLVFGVIAGYYLSRGHFGIASVFSVLAALFDGLDGMVARLSGSVSRRGEVLDSSIDRYVEFFFFGGLLMYYQFSPSLQLLCLAALLGSYMVSYSSAKAEIVKVKAPQGGMRRPERVVYLVVGIVLSSLTLPFEHPSSQGYKLAYPLVVALIIIAVFANLTAIHRLLVIARAADQPKVS